MALTINHQTNDISATSGSVTIDGAAACGDPTTTQVLNATAGASVGAVGTYAFMNEDALNRPYRLAGSTLAGSSLFYARLGGSGNCDETSASGTWRLMGQYHPTTSYNDYPTSVWLRIS